VLHKELLYALDAGVRVLGAASMGALRAAELWPYGMEGVGEVYARLRSEAIERDDEVAVVHGPAEAGFRATSVALVAIRVALERAERAGLLDAALARELVAASSERFYPERSWRRLLDDARAAGMDTEPHARLARFLQEEAGDVKREDAALLLGRLRDGVPEPARAPAAGFVFEETVFWQRTVEQIGPSGGERRGGVPAAALRIRPDGREVLRGATLLHQLRRLVRSGRIEIPADELDAARARFRRARGLLGVEATREWMREQDVSEEELEELVRAEVAWERLLAADEAAVLELTDLELKRRGAYAEEAAAARAKARVLEEAGVGSLELAHAGVSLTELLDWYQQEFMSIHGTLAEHATWLGFESVRDFLSEVLLEHRTRELSAAP
jgi:hypothetical protein